MNARNVLWGGAAIIVLAGLDLAGALLAKEFSLRPRWVLLVSGLAAFCLLFIVYVRSLRVTELWIVTFGWVVVLEVGVLLLDRIRFSTDIPTHKLALAAVIVGLQILLMVPSGSKGAHERGDSSQQRVTRVVKSTHPSVGYGRETWARTVLSSRRRSTN